MKKFYGIMAITVVAAAAGWHYNQSQNELELSDLALANIEALASNESTVGKYCLYYEPLNNCFNLIGSTVCYGVTPPECKMY